MPRNGSGGFSLVAGNPVVTGTTINSTDFNNTMTDLATAMAGSVAADGQTAWTGNQNANGNRLTGLGVASALSDASAATDAQSGRLTFLTGVAGTNTITASLVLLATYTAGQVFRFIAAGTNTGAATLNINSLGALAIVRPDGSSLAPGEITNTAMVTVVYDGTRFQMQSAPPIGRLIGVRVISATGTYTPTVGTNSVVVELVGGGGAGGGAATTGVGQVAAGAGGSAGGYAKSRLTTGFAGVTVTIGPGGVGAAGATGGNGGASSFGAVFSATGGTGGPLGTAVGSGTITFVRPGVGGAGSSGNLVNATGQPGGNSLYISGTALSGFGGASMFGGGGAPVQDTSGGVAATSFGAGGSGAALLASSGPGTGGNGSQGVCLVWEYA